jgi:hypothetical protein
LFINANSGNLTDEQKNLVSCKIPIYGTDQLNPPHRKFLATALNSFTVEEINFILLNLLVKDYLPKLT